MPSNATTNRKNFDVEVEIETHKNHQRVVPGDVIAMHIGGRATRAGAIGPAMGMVKGIDRRYVVRVTVSECDGYGCIAPINEVQGA